MTSTMDPALADVIQVVDAHPGEHPNNGGDYGYGRDFCRQPDGTWLVAYWSTYDGDYCPHTGRYDPCEEGCNYERLSTEQVLALVAGRPLVAVRPGRRDPAAVVAVFDGTI